MTFWFAVALVNEWSGTSKVAELKPPSSKSSRWRRRPRRGLASSLDLHYYYYFGGDQCKNKNNNPHKPQAATTTTTNAMHMITCSYAHLNALVPTAAAADISWTTPPQAKPKPTLTTDRVVCKLPIFPLWINAISNNQRHRVTYEITNFGHVAAGDQNNNPKG